MRVLHVLPYDPRQPGGVQTHTFALSGALTELGCESDVFAPSRPWRIPLGGTRADIVWHPVDLWRLRRALRQPRDVVHIQEPLLPLLGPLTLLHPGSTPVVVTLHSAERAAQRWYRWTAPLSRMLLGRADAVICASEVSRRTAEPVLPSSIEQIYPCLDLSAFLAVEPEPEPQTVLFVGRDEPRKGLPTLLDAIARVPDARLLVAGPVSNATRRLASEQVTFLGPVLHDEIPTLMRRATCFAAPSTSGEALGLVLVEAMAAGLPVAASDIDGYRIASDDGRAALLSAPNDANALAKNLVRLLSDRALRERLIRAGRESAARFDARVVAQRHLDLYRAVADA